MKWSLFLIKLLSCATDFFLIRRGGGGGERFFFFSQSYAISKLTVFTVHFVTPYRATSRREGSLGLKKTTSSLSTWDTGRHRSSLLSVNAFYYQDLSVNAYYYQDLSVNAYYYQDLSVNAYYYQDLSVVKNFTLSVDNNALLFFLFSLFSKSSSIWTPDFSVVCLHSGLFLFLSAYTLVSPCLIRIFYDLLKTWHLTRAQC